MIEKKLINGVPYYRFQNNNGVWSDWILDEQMPLKPKTETQTDWQAIAIGAAIVLGVLLLLKK